MRNLTLWEVSVRHLTIDSDEKLAICHGHDEGKSASDLYVCTHNLNLSNFNENGEIKWTKDLSEHASQDNSPLSVTYLTLTNTLCVGLGNGELFTLADGGSVCDMVGVFDCGLLAMEWSPDQELLALVTKEMKTILMSCTFDPINEVNLLDQEFGEKQFITVGWGKKETQFHGLAGKQAAKLKNEVEADPNALSDTTVKITWRGDGHLYAIGYAMDGIRRFKVFDREGQLQYTSEKQQGLETNLCWRPSGSLIATTQKLPEKYLVSFFEKNGLKHGEFDITDKSIAVEDIAWSSDSEILTLLCMDKESNTQKLLLYTTSNYHWYLKQSLPFDKKHKISKIMWDNDFDISNNKKLHVILNDGTYYMFNWNWNIDHSNGNCDKDDAVVAVIDGSKILLTGFRQTVVPPPMSALEIHFDNFINSVHFAPKASKLDSNLFFICTSNNKLVFYEQTKNNPLQYENYKTISLDKYDYPFQYYNWFWVNNNTLVCITLDKDYRYSLVEYAIESSTIVKRNTSSLPAPVTRLQLHPIDGDVLFMELNNGDIIQYKLGENVDIHNISFNTPCPKFNVLNIENILHFIGLSYKGNLFIDDRMIMNNVSSYFVHTHFLLITTLQHTLLCTELTAAGLNAIIEYEKNESEHVYKRKIERGAKLVVAVPNETRTVFQMPRGNLEAIQPRPLSLKIIGAYLNNFKYHEVFDLMRKQRINLNLFYDHDPDKFIKNIDVFLEKIKNNSWLNLFLADLENVDVTKTMYASSYANKTNQVKTNHDTKVQRICDIVRENLLKRSDSDNRILPILTTFVKKNNVRDLEKALLIIKELKLKESGGSKLPVGSDEALKYLLYMVDVNQLFDVALGIYDFDLVLLVANKSQKDPKEYIPMLNELNEMDENYKKFSINKHLKRFDKAVNCLVKCGSEKYNELKTFVKYHSLYKEALSQFSPDSEIFKEISEDFGSYLKLKRQYTEAGLVFERANNIEKAVECYNDALEWEMAISLAQIWPKDKFRELCWGFINALREEKRHKEALTILEQYYDDCEETILYAIESSQYKTALRLCSQYKKPKLKEERLLPTLMDDYKNIQDHIESNWCNFMRHRNRLSVVRENKSKNPVENLYDSYVNKDSDLYSDAGSTLASSKGSSRSYRSSKNRRKHERKVASLKEGSQYEDVALVMALHSLVTSSFELRHQVKEVVIALSCFSKYKEAFVLQTSLEKLLKEMKDSFRDIWTNELVLEATNAQIAAYDVPEGVSVIPQGIATLEPHIRIAPVIQDINWKLDGLN